MKKIFMFLVLSSLFYGCSDSSEKSISIEKSLANVAHDSSNYGIYKGVFIGSTGAILININNDNSVIALVTINDVETTYTSNSIVKVNQTTNVQFVNGTNTFEFNVDGNGRNPTISKIMISSHPNAEMAVLKETSTSLVKCYLGTYSGPDFGTFNIICKYGKVPYLSGILVDEWMMQGIGISKKYNQSFTISGLANWKGEINGVYSIGSKQEGNFVGSYGETLIKGSWKNIIAKTNGNWTGLKHNFTKN